ncbi:MAG: hypothetical protein FJW21_06485 [Acidimicrobiia bacterium]|nr:hypothetical protein [Acidimicrobiia bacterium]
MKWRRWNNTLHRDVGYLVVALTLVYGISGLAINHMADWNPSYRQQKTALTIQPLTATDRDGMIKEALPQLGITEEPRNAFRPDPDTLQIFLPEKTYLIDVPTGQVIVDRVRPRPVLFEMNQMHLNATKGVWTVIADVYAVALIFMAISGMFVLRGKTGFTGRGKWFVLGGALVPLGYYILR